MQCNVSALRLYCACVNKQSASIICYVHETVPSDNYKNKPKYGNVVFRNAQYDAYDCDSHVRYGNGDILGGG